MKNYSAPSETLFNKVNNFIHSHKERLLTTPERALEQAYQAALKIQSIESQYFGGEKVSNQSKNYSQNVLACFQADIDKCLSIIKLRIAEFKISRFLLRDCDYAFLERLKFIDEVLITYNTEESPELKSVESCEKSLPLQVEKQSQSKKAVSRLSLTDIEPVTQKTGVLPRSIGRTIRKIKTEVGPNSEEELVRNFRTSRQAARQAVKFLVLLLVIPLLTQEVSKQFLILPVVEHFRKSQETPVFINWEMKEEALRELQTFEEEIKFEQLIKHYPQITSEALEEKVEQKATQIAEEFKLKSNSAISNIFADFLGLIAFAGVVVNNSKGVVAVKTLLNEVIYGLSDSAKAFIIILFTDIFVGFHSPHGWEVILESLANHFGLPADERFTYLFIATFPVILDTIFKYWIFRYLNQISPSAVATLKNMNE
jgi:hypothetical protein